MTVALAGTEDHPQARMVLLTALASGEPSHAYLFHGPAGTGKRTVARAFAAECLAREPGCLEFQVVRLYSTSSAAPHVLFFEAYDDAAAFDAHCASAHLVRFKAAFQAMVSSEQPLRQGRRVQEVA